MRDEAAVRQWPADLSEICYFCRGKSRQGLNILDLEQRKLTDRA